MKTILGIAFMFLAVSAHAQTGASGWKTFSQNGYKIKYPKTWLVDSTSHAPPVELVLYIPPVKGATHTTNINLVSQDMDGESMTIDQFGATAMDEIKKASDSVIIYESKLVTTDRGQYYKMIFGFNKNGTDYKFEQRCIIHNGRRYVDTFTSTKKEFSQLKGTAERILDSLTFD